MMCRVAFPPDASVDGKTTETALRRRQRRPCLCFRRRGRANSASSSQALSEIRAVQPEKTNLENLLSAVLALPPAPRNLLPFYRRLGNRGQRRALAPAAAAAGNQNLSDVAGGAPGASPTSP